MRPFGSVGLTEPYLLASCCDSPFSAYQASGICIIVEEIALHDERAVPSSLLKALRLFDYIVCRDKEIVPNFLVRYLGKRAGIG